MPSSEQRVLISLTRFDVASSRWSPTRRKSRSRRSRYRFFSPASAAAASVCEKANVASYRSFRADASTAYALSFVSASEHASRSGFDVAVCDGNVATVSSVENSASSAASTPSEFSHVSAAPPVCAATTASHAFFERAMIASASALTCAVVKFHCSRTGALASSDATSASPLTSSPASTHTSHAFSGGGPESLKPMKPLAVRSVQHGQGGLTVSIFAGRSRSISLGRSPAKSSACT